MTLMRWSVRPVFHGPVILSYILKTIGWLKIKLLDNESVWPKHWPENECRSVAYISWSGDFALYLEDYMMDEHQTLDSESVRCNFWPQNNGRLQWPSFHIPVILPCILKTIEWMNIQLLDTESVWHLWPQNECRSQWLIFHGLAILSDILKTIWLMNIKRLDNESVWHSLWPQIRSRDLSYKPNHTKTQLNPIRVKNPRRHQYFYVSNLKCMLNWVSHMQTKDREEFFQWLSQK